MQYDEQDVEQMFGAISQKEDDTTATMSEERKAALWNSINEKLIITTTATALGGWTIFKTSLFKGQYALFYKLIFPVVFAGGIGVGYYAYQSSTEKKTSSKAKITAPMKQPNLIENENTPKLTEQPRQLLPTNTAKNSHKQKHTTASIINNSNATAAILKDSIAPQTLTKEDQSTNLSDSAQSAIKKQVVMHKRVTKQVVVKQSTVLLSDSSNVKQ